MKQKDIALIIIVVFISAVMSVLISQQLIVPPKNRQQKVEVVQKIDTDFPLPDQTFFNPSAINPTKQITIGETSNPDPFSNKQ